MVLKAIVDITKDTWVELEAEIFQIWENEHEAIRQVGLLKDDTSIVKFVSWEKANKPLLSEGVTYRFTNLPVSEYNGKLSVTIVSISKIERVGTVQSEIPTV